MYLFERGGKRLDSFVKKGLSLLIALLMIISLVSGIGIFSASTAYAEGENIYYVSSDSVSTNWNAALNISTPCTVDTAIANAVAGDTVYFLEGTYNTTPVDGDGYDQHYHARWEPAHSGTALAPITFAAYPGAVVVINGIVPGEITTSQSSPDMIRVFSTGSQDYIIFDGFVIRATNGVGGDKIGSIIIGYDSYNWNLTSDGCIIRNCTFDGGTATILCTDNRECIRIEWTQNTLVQNCVVKNVRQLTNYHNTNAIKMYHNKNTIIEKCEIFNCTTGIFDKSDGQFSTFRYNYIHHCSVGIETQSFNVGVVYNHPDMTIHNNVIAYTEYAAISDVTEENSSSDRMKIYNNTIYTGNQISASINLAGGYNKEFYNNIIYGLKKNNDLGMLRFWPGTNVIATTVTIAACDHNQYGNLPNNFLIRIRRPNGDGTATYASYYTLAAWQASTELVNGGHPGVGSLASNPMFLNASGTMLELDDFRLAAGSPCLGTDRNGGDMGANIDLVGIQGSVPQIFTVTFDRNGGSVVGSVNVEEGSLLEEPVDPVKSGYIFTGWFKDAGLTDDWDFAVDVVTDNITLYAKWECDAYYVSSTATSTNWTAAKNISTPCTVATAMTNAVAGDMVYFLAGTYNTDYLNDYHARWEPQNSGTASDPITFAAYPGAQVIINGIAPAGTQMVRVFSTGSQDYIIFDGFIIQANDGAKMGSIIIGYNTGSWSNTSDNCIVRNCTLDGGSATLTAGRECVRIEWTQNTLVKNCTIKNALGSYGYGIKMLKNRNAIVENCEIFNCGTGILDFGESEFSTFRHNYIHNCSLHGISIWNYTGNNHSDMSIYDNVIAFCGQTGINDYVEGTGCSDRLKIYNNNIYSGNIKSASVNIGAGQDKEVYNNIIYGLMYNTDLGMLRFWPGTSASAVTVTIAACDHNQYGNLTSNFKVRVRRPDGLGGATYATYSSLTAWQASTELAGGGHPGVGSLASDPGFANGSGTMSELDDFRLAAGSPCLGAGRSGADMGADIDLAGVE